MGLRNLIWKGGRKRRGGDNEVPPLLSVELWVMKGRIVRNEISGSGNSI